MSTMNYKSYQQVFALSKPGKCTTITKAKMPQKAAPAKKRTKTGCLTCRRRKKKCDEEVVGGKCQGCIRNFMDCCWPEEEKAQCATPKLAPVASAKPVSTPTKGASAYPSPVMSPRSEDSDSCKDIKPLELPPSKYKVTKPKPARKATPAQFVVTSFDQDRALCQIKC